MIRHNLIALQETLNLIGGIINKPLTANHLMWYKIVNRDEYVEETTPTFKGKINDGVNFMQENIDEFILYDKLPNVSYGSKKPKVQIIFIRK